MDINPMDIDLQELFESAVSMHKFMAEGKDLKFLASFDPALPRFIHSDDVRIRQIITNLLSNAIKYTQRGSVEFRLDKDSERSKLIIAVKDTGVGIEKKDISRIFGKFEQLDQMKNHGVVGTGLGLSITKEIVEMMSGTISVESCYGKGSMFKVELPLEEGSFSTTAKRQSAKIMAKSARVLVVDDNTINLKVALSYLARHNIQAHAATSGEEAIMKAKKANYHLILMDHMMPEMDGVEATAAIRALPGDWYKTSPIVALSANAVSGAQELFLKSGMNDHLAKPIDAASLNVILGKWLPNEEISQNESMPVERKPAGAILAESNLKGDEKGMEGKAVSKSDGLKNCAEDEELYQEMLSDFLEGHSEDMEKIAEAASSGDLLATQRLAHTLKSSSTLIGALKLRDEALKIELETGNDKKLPDEAALNSLRQAHQEAMEEIRDMAGVV
jgi:CheY-like chemotaxis protein/HPt (histidine-containing phosphotransfer) domain-containing protein/anti-sigma regulatory factor (Ser/Thr protein kinase)